MCHLFCFTFAAVPPGELPPPYEYAVGNGMPQTGMHIVHEMQDDRDIYVEIFVTFLFLKNFTV